ncbi:hypothetical protein [Streptomyces anulatus]|uniref:hypothetical protein n=1 Tax=Streptomyces anulatus TaxID=1892 RepID=UPI003411586B
MVQLSRDMAMGESIASAVLDLPILHQAIRLQPATVPTRHVHSDPRAPAYGSS